MRLSAGRTVVENQWSILHNQCTCKCLFHTENLFVSHIEMWTPIYSMTKAKWTPLFQSALFWWIRASVKKFCWKYNFAAGFFQGKPSRLQRWARTRLDRTGSGLKPILAGSGLDRTTIFLKIGGSGQDSTDKICCFDVNHIKHVSCNIYFADLLNGNVYFAINGKALLGRFCYAFTFG